MDPILITAIVAASASALTSIVAVVVSACTCVRIEEQISSSSKQDESILITNRVHTSKDGDKHESTKEQTIKIAKSAFEAMQQKNSISIPVENNTAHDVGVGAANALGNGDIINQATGAANNIMNNLAAMRAQQQQAKKLNNSTQPNNDTPADNISENKDPEQPDVPNFYDIKKNQVTFKIDSTDNKLIFFNKNGVPLPEDADIYLSTGEKVGYEIKDDGSVELFFYSQEEDSYEPGKTSYNQTESGEELLPYKTTDKGKEKAEVEQKTDHQSNETDGDVSLSGDNNMSHANSYES